MKDKDKEMLTEVLQRLVETIILNLDSVKVLNTMEGLDSIEIKAKFSPAYMESTFGITGKI